MPSRIPSVTNRAADYDRGMTLRELATFVGDAYRAPHANLDAPVRVATSLTGKVRSISAPLELPTDCHMCAHPLGQHVNRDCGTCTGCSEARLTR